MGGEKEAGGGPSDLRRRAEKALHGESPDTVDLPDIGLSAGEMRRLVHELRVHQIELEMQNQELRRAHNALEALKDKYVELYDFAPAGYLSMENHGIISEANLSACRLLGIERSRLIKQPLSRFVLVEDGDAYYLHCQQVLYTRSRQRCEIRMVRIDATVFHGQMETVPVWDDRGEVIGYRTILLDISERKRAEQERGRRIAGLGSLVQAGADILAVQSVQEMLDRVVHIARVVTQAKVGTAGYGVRDGQFQAASTSLSADAPPLPLGSIFAFQKGEVWLNFVQCRGTHRLTAEELCNHPLRSGPPEGREMLEDALAARLAAPDGVTTGVIVVACPEERHFTEEDELLLSQLAHLVSLGIQQLEAREALRIARDDLELRVAERTDELARTNQALEAENRQRRKAEDALKSYAERLEQSNRSLQDFAFIASHDLQEPVRKIQLFGDRLKLKWEHSLDDAGRDYLDRMLSAARRMHVLIDVLLQYSRVSTTAAPFTRVNLTEVTREVVDDLTAALEETGGRIEIGQLATIEADPSQMRRLFQNLISNALKFRGEEPPVVKVYGRSTGGEGTGSERYQILVEDNGMGFDEKHVDRIFKPLQRLHGVSAYPGSGMGLAICRRIVERHHGRITATSAPGKGSTFIVTLPLKQPEEALSA